MKKGIVTLIGVAGLATAATAQTAGTYEIRSSNVVTPATPSTTIEIWATWSDPAAGFVFGGGNYDLTAGDGVFSGETNVLNGPGSSAGVAAGNTVTGGANGQLHLPALGFIGSQDNPILMASYTWTTGDFTARNVAVDSSNTNNFIVADFVTGATTNLFPGEFRDGAGSIVVTPAPSALALLGLGGLVATRRRR
jgi:MYXO-CTERM domain-containing protein